MNLNKLVSLIFDNASSLNINKGKELYSKGLISNIKSRKINNMYHIYGEAKNENKALTHNTHIIINLQEKRLEQTKCSCESYISSAPYKKNYVCDHIAGTAEMFYKLANKKVNTPKGSTSSNKNNGDIILERLKNQQSLKEKISVGVKVNFITTSSLEYYEVEFRVGTKTMHLIRDLDAFINAKNNEETLRFSNEFVYKPKLHYFSPEDEKIISFIEEYIKITKNTNLTNNSSSFYIASGRNLRILPSGIERFLSIVKNKNVDFKYEHISCETQVYNKDLPISLTLRERDNMFILSAPKNIPVDLTRKGKAYFYNRKIYLPSFTQDKAYQYIYNDLKNSGALFFSKSIESYLLLANLLNNITNDVNHDEAIKHFSSNLAKPKFYFSVANENIDNILLNVKLYYGQQAVDLINGIDDKSFVIRDTSKEQRIEMELEKLKFIKRDGFFVFIGDDSDRFHLLKNGLNHLRTLGEVYLSDEFNSIKLFDRSSISLSIDRSKDSMLNISYVFGDIEEDEIEHIMKAFKSNRRFYKSRNRSFLDLENTDVRDFINLIDVLGDLDGKNKGSIKIDENKGLFLENKLQNSHVEISRGEEILKDLSNKFSEVEMTNYEIPSNLNATLRSYQETGYKWLKTLSNLGFGGILADEMGLGKTIQTITFILSEAPKKTLIIVPTSLIYNWKDEFEKFAPSLQIGIVHGDKSERTKILGDMDSYDVILTTYGTLKRDFEHYENIVFDYAIIDEGQNIKNHTTKNTIAVKSIKAKGKFALTGTPMENNMLELWSIFDFIMPGYLYTKEKFQDKFIYGINGNIEELRKLISPFILRREKKEVLLELPDKVNKKFLVEMTKSQRLVYNSYMKQVREKMKKEKENKLEVFSYLTKLRQICLDPILFLEDYSGGSGKIDIAMDLVLNSIESGSKILLFSQFTSVLSIFEKALEANNIKHLYLDGSTPAKKRVELVNEFNESSDIKVFLISLKAGGTGLNLTSANMVIHFDPWWNPAIEDQATDRAHRIGQKNMVEVIKLVAKGTIEEKIILLQEEKKELINNLIHGDIQDKALIDTLSYDELISLFAD